MKHNARKLLAVILVLAMVLSFVAVAEDGLTELGTDQPIEIEGGFEGEDQTGNDGDTQAPEGELEIDMDEAEGLPDGAIDPEGGEDLPIDLDGEALETFEEALAPETEAAMNDVQSKGTEGNPYLITGSDAYNGLVKALGPDGEKRDDEDVKNPT